MPTGLAIAQPLASACASITSRATAAERGRRQVRQQLVVGEHELEPQRVAVDRLQALDRRIVVEVPGCLRFLDHRIGAGEASVDHLQRVRAHLRIEDALDRVDVVGGDELALLALEHRIVGEIIPGRMWIVQVLPSSEISGIALAVFGTSL